MSRPTISSAYSAIGRSGSFCITNLPIFLCPSLSGILYSPLQRYAQAKDWLCTTPLLMKRRPFHSNVDSLPESTHCKPDQKAIPLPLQCSGCGALSQAWDRKEPGFFSPGRTRAVKAYLISEGEKIDGRRSMEDATLAQPIKSVDSAVLESLRFEKLPLPAQKCLRPVCDRCHQLLHHHQSGMPIHHPSIESIKDTIVESPHKYNHVYHTIDAADFPLSLIPRLHQLLHLTPQRSLNRRSRVGRFYHGRKTEVSFIITRSDLLAPSKAQVDSLMPYLVSVLRDSLGSAGMDVRLGNVRCVSAKRGWWTKELKEEIWKRGHGGWMVGRVNVGKSQLFGSVFPKGRRITMNLEEPHRAGVLGVFVPVIGDEKSTRAPERDIPAGSLEFEPRTREIILYENSSLLPPLQAEVDYPAMPLVSPFPGTTTSPIRVPFGNGKGELVDLPGLPRGDLDQFVQESHRSSLLMRSRIVPEQHVMKPGQSLLLGGFLRITPVTADAIILAYAFTPLSAHLTSTDKAIDIQIHGRASGVENIAKSGVGENIKSAGVFPLKWDVTKQRSGPITSPSAIGIKAEKLPYRVLSTDILIEGCGWVELVAQIRRKAAEPETLLDSEDKAYVWPQVEVFSPQGDFIAARKPLGAWVLGGPKRHTGIKGRPRKSMKGAKKKLKALKQMTES